jgi:hypothetical protein
MGSSAERGTSNDARFNAANDQIFDSAIEYEVTAAIPFLCECADPKCREIIRLDASEYERIRKSGRSFIAPGHATAFANARQILERHATYEVVASVGGT